jgi:hypothetical protein
MGAISNLQFNQNKKKQKTQSLHKTKDYHVRCLIVFGSSSNKVVMRATANNTHNILQLMVLFNLHLFKITFTIYF